MSPGWIIAAPRLAESLLAITWLLLRIKLTPLRTTSEPSVPPQQVFPLDALMLLPDVPSTIAPFWAACPGASKVSIAEPVDVGLACETAVIVTVALLFAGISVPEIKFGAV